MKNILTLLFCLCIIFSSFGFAESTERQAAKSEFSFVSSKTVAENEFPNIFRPIGNWFKRIFGKSRRIVEPPFPSVENLTLSRTEVAASCSINNDSCSNNKPIIEISAEGRDWDGKEVVYKYQVSAGQIIGSGSKVVGVTQLDLRK